MSDHDMVSRKNQLERLHDTPKVVRQAIGRGEFDKLEDGFWYYFPGRGGAIASYQLREIADELDKRNKPLEEAINVFFEEAAKDPDSFLNQVDDEDPFKGTENV